MSLIFFAALPDSESILNTMTSITKQRVKLNIKVLGVQLGEKGATTGGSAAHPNNQTGTGSVNSDGEKQTSREQFKAPEMSIVSKLMAKVWYIQLFVFFFLLSGNCKIRCLITFFAALAGW